MVSHYHPQARKYHLLPRIRVHISIQYAISTSVSINISTGKDIELCASTQRDTIPNTDTVCFVCIYFTDVSWMKTRFRFSPNENMPTIAFEAKPRLTHEENSSPLITHPVEC
ncbi:hypothetical protein TNCV_2303451 [Trichonephila clavipes]|nr:hypothetical protein TNCV_2303451 [Trichonephila clavipes]